MTDWLKITALAATVAGAWPTGTPPRAQDARVLACDTLVNLRILMGAGDRARAESALPAHFGCRAIPRERIGAAEHRAMVGGAPFECLTVEGEAGCVWVWP